MDSYNYMNIPNRVDYLLQYFSVFFETNKGIQRTRICQEYDILCGFIRMIDYEQSRNILMSRLTRTKTVQELADMYLMEPESINRIYYRMKKKVKKQLIEFLQLIETERSNVIMESLTTKRFIRYKEAAEMYSVGIQTISRLAKKAHATYKIGGVVLVDIAKLDEYLENYHEGESV